MVTSQLAQEPQQQATRQVKAWSLWQSASALGLYQPNRWLLSLSDPTA